MEIYLDTLFLENLVINYFILLLTGKGIKLKTSNLRLFLGALIGAAYVVLLILLPGIKIYYTVPAKFLLSLVIVAVAFSPEKVGIFLKTLAAFYISTFVFAGAAFAFLYFNQSGGFVQNGIFYAFWDAKWTDLVFAMLAVGIILRIFWEIFQHRMLRDKLLIPLKISFESKIIDLSALVDTGNSLRDPLTNMPVVVVEFKAIQNILPEEIQRIFEQFMEDDLTQVTNVVSASSWFSRFRLIPFTSLGKENGMLIGFKPDYIEVGEEKQKKGICDVIIGIYNRALSKNEKYKALLGPELI